MEEKKSQNVRGRGGEGKREIVARGIVAGNVTHGRASAFKQPSSSSTSMRGMFVHGENHEGRELQVQTEI